MVLKRREVDFRHDFEVTFNGARLFDRDRYVEDIKEQAGDSFARMREQQDFIGDGNSAAVNVLKRIVTGLVGYPITPSARLPKGWPRPMPMDSLRPWRS